MIHSKINLISKKKLHFIHVGKCAGSSVKKALESLNINCIYYHCFDANKVLSKKLISASSDDYFLLLIRDPISRFISAFYYDFYKKIIIEDNNGPNGVWKSLYGIFRKPNEVGEALSHNDKKLRSAAQTFIFKSHLHAHYSLAWYVSFKNLKYLNHNNLHIIKSENADLDFQDFLMKNFSIADYGLLPKEKSDYKSLIKGFDPSLTKLAKKNLKDAYYNDYQVLSELYRRRLIDIRY